MIRHVMTSTALAVALLASGSAFAQTETAPTAQQAGDYMAADIIGANVRNAQGESLGSVGDLVLDKDGKVKAAVLSVGGFLGIGDKRVAVAWDQLQIRADASGAPATGATTGAGGAAPAARDPMLVVNMTKDQLKAAPEFKTLAQQARDADRARTAPTGAPATAPGTTRTAPAN
jgi:hypothetical protein